MSGKPYISVKRATRKAVNAPNDRQSRAVVGRAKLNAKTTNTATFRMTRSQSPYAEPALVIGPLRRGARGRRRLAVTRDVIAVRRAALAYRGSRALCGRGAAAGTRGGAGTAARRGRAPCARSGRRTRR